MCIERAVLVTDFFRRFDDPSEPMVVRKAKALRHVLQNKSVCIYPDELIVGNPGGWRKSALMQPELASVFMSTELLWLERRKTTPLRIGWGDRLTLATRVLPYWLRRNMIVRAFKGRRRHMARVLVDQLAPSAYIVNEAGGIGHFLPNYERMLRQGVRGYLQDIAGKNAPLHAAARIACEGIVTFANRLAAEADRLASLERDPTRADELSEIGRICRRVPEHPATSLHEAVQSLWLTHMCVCLESINSAVSIGRLDQILHPYYARDRGAGAVTPEAARELLLCFSAKATEHVFLLSETASEYHGGFLVAQAAVVGGVDESGHDAVNELTYVLLDVMEESGLREPNYQARVHDSAPREYVERVVDVARQGRGVPAIFNDHAVIASLAAHGVPDSVARSYAIVGCVEPAIPGASFLSTDAALVNLPLCLELALNEGRRFGHRLRAGAPTPPVRSLGCIDDVLRAFADQIAAVIARLSADLRVIEAGHRDYHPTPLSSLLVDGCLASGKDLTEGGARQNGSGVQGVGVADVADSLAALDSVVFARKQATLSEVVTALIADFEGHAALRGRLRSAPKYGNDETAPDAFAARVAEIFHDALAPYTNTRGGRWMPGFYSSTTHVAFGRRTGALPSGRRAGEPFAASLGCANGCDRKGPTALLRSVGKVDARLSPNGYALNLRFDPATVAGARGTKVLSALVRGFFRSGGMELQLNVLDPRLLAEARAHPGMHPGLVVRVAGYCAYFDDLPEGVKDEIIERTRLAAS